METETKMEMERALKERNMSQLKYVAKELGTSGYSRLRKKDLIDHIVHAVMVDEKKLPRGFKLPRKENIPSRPAPVVERQRPVPTPRTIPLSQPPPSTSTTVSRRPSPPPPPSTSTTVSRRPPPPPPPPRNLPEQTAPTGTWLNWLGERIMSLSRSVVDVLPQRARPFAEGLLNRVENVLRTEPMEMARPLNWEMPSAEQEEEVEERGEVEEEPIVPTEAANTTPNLNLSELEREQMEVEEALECATKTVTYKANEGSVFDVNGFSENKKEDILTRLSDSRKPIKTNFVINCLMEMRKPDKPLDHTNLYR